MTIPSDWLTAPWDVVVIGAGAAGLVAATRAAERGLKALLLEKNPHAGVKILMSGGTRCNLTQNTDKRGIVQAFGDQGPFLHSALAALTPSDLVKMVEDEGVATKIEDTGKIFPVSDDARDIVAALVRRLNRSGATLVFRAPVTRLQRVADAIDIETAQGIIRGRKVIVTTGGKSYPGCGTSGDGYNWLADLGHTLAPLRPALTPITTDAEWVRALQGVTLPDVLIRVAPADKSVAGGPPTSGKRRKDNRGERRSSLLFTHFGMSGPAALDVSREISGHPNPSSLCVVCDFCPDQNTEQVDEHLRRELAIDGRRQSLGIIPPHLPKRIAETIFSLADLNPTTRCAELPKAGRLRLVEQLKQTRIPVSGTMGFKKAEVTAGGVPLIEVDSHTMESKIVPNLYFAGEILDLDGPIGGYNFQAAFSTGILAGDSV